MIGLDTGVLFGLLEQGQSARFRAAEAMLKRAGPAGDCFIHPLVLAEIAHALERGLKLDRAKVADYLDYILHAPEFTVEGVGAAIEAVARYRTGTARFADCLLAALNLAAGCETTVTFAGKADDSAGFTLLAG
jgi:predicted nucleic-acid-binding protein